MAALENRFTWSSSRAGSFDYCQRQYWWSYYGSWGGWKRDAPLEARDAYMLKNLASRWTWAGTVVHETIERALRRLQGGGDGMLALGGRTPDAEAEIEAATQRMRDQWAESRAADYRRRPKKSFGLIEHEYDEPVAREEWQAANDRVRDGLRAFFASELFAHIRASDPSDWLPIETLDQFDFEGTAIWAVLDFAMRTPEGGVEIFDWKTGAVHPEGNRLQVGCYALYVQAAHDVPAERVGTNLVYLGTDLQAFRFRMTQAELASVRGEMRASIAAMRTRLRDKVGNVAVRDDFPLTDDLSKCESCAFRRLCGRGGGPPRR